MKVTKKMFKLYEKLLSDISEYNDTICPFFIQVGKKYNQASKKIIFVGKSPNGWVTDDRDVNSLFDDSNPERIVNRHDQMEWIHYLEGNKEGYNTKKSPFWRVVKLTSENILGKQDWYNYVAWSNLYKIAPEKGTPGIKLRRIQQITCNEILSEEINILNPDAVIFLASDWADSYLKSLGIPLNDFHSVTWGEYSTQYKENDGVLYIQSQNTQGKLEEPHVNALINILNKD